MKRPYTDTLAEVKASSPIRTSLFEREGSMWGCLKRPSQRLKDEERLFPNTFRAMRHRLDIPDCYRGLVERARSNDAEICHKMLTAYGLTEAQMLRAANHYRIGKSRSGKTIYWMIDEQGIWMDGHLGDAWVTQLLQHRYPDIAPYIHSPHCLFGLHLLSPLTANRSVAIVESEQSAVVLSELFPELLWMAYAYPANLTVDRFKSLRGRTVTLFPRADLNGDDYYFLLDIADQAHRRFPAIDLRVSSFLEVHATDAQKERHIDLLDFIMENDSKTSLNSNL